MGWYFGERTLGNVPLILFDIEHRVCVSVHFPFLIRGLTYLFPLKWNIGMFIALFMVLVGLINQAPAVRIEDWYA